LFTFVIINSKHLSKQGICRIMNNENAALADGMVKSDRPVPVTMISESLEHIYSVRVKLPVA